MSSSPSSAYTTNPKGRQAKQRLQVSRRPSTQGVDLLQGFAIQPQVPRQPQQFLVRRRRRRARVRQLLQLADFLAGDLFQLCSCSRTLALRGRSVSVREGRARIRVMVRLQDASSGGSQAKAPDGPRPCGLPARAADIRIRTARRCRHPCSAGQPACAAGVPIRCAVRAGGCRCAAGPWRSLRRTRRHCGAAVPAGPPLHG